MALSMHDMVRGTIVDHSHEWVAEEQQLVLRPVRRRGIIVKAKGDANSGGVAEVWVQFKGDKPEKVAPRELDRVFPWNHPVAKKALARISGRSEMVGAEFQEKRAPVRPRVEDALAITPRRRQSVVEPEEEENDPMLEAQTEIVPLVVPDTDVTP